MEAIALACFIAGSLLILLAGVGVVRFREVTARMHASAKAPILGLILIGLGVIVSLRTWEAAAIVVLVLLLQSIAVPVGSHVLARSIYYRMHPDLDGPDELAEANHDAERQN